MVFNAQIVNHTQAGVSVNVADAGSGATAPVTYEQIRNSLGNHNYNVDSFFLYATNYNQLVGVINYIIYDSDGVQTTTNITTAVDMYQNTTSLSVDLKKLPIPILLNGNSSISTTILANTFLQINLYTTRITNSFGLNLNNFNEMNKLLGLDFFQDYGDEIQDIQVTNALIQGENFEENKELFKNFVGNSNKNQSVNFKAFMVSALFGLSALYLLKKTK